MSKFIERSVYLAAMLAIGAVLYVICVAGSVLIVLAFAIYGICISPKLAVNAVRKWRQKAEKAKRLKAIRPLRHLDLQSASYKWN